MTKLVQLDAHKGDVNSLLRTVKMFVFILKQSTIQICFLAAFTSNVNNLGKIISNTLFQVVLIRSGLPVNNDTVTTYRKMNNLHQALSEAQRLKASKTKQKVDLKHTCRYLNTHNRLLKHLNRNSY